MSSTNAVQQQRLAGLKSLGSFWRMVSSTNAVRRIHERAAARARTTSPSTANDAVTPPYVGFARTDT